MSARDDAYIDFVQSRRDHLRRVAYALCGDWHRADDLVQIALVKLYVAWPRVRRTGSEEAYARRILVRVAIDEGRRPWRRERPTADLPDHGTTTAAEDRPALVAALRELPGQQRAAVVLRHWLGLSVAEAAATMGVTEGTVKSHTSRGLAGLRDVLGPDLTDARHGGA